MKGFISFNKTLCLTLLMMISACSYLDPTPLPSPTTEITSRSMPTDVPITDISPTPLIAPTWQTAPSEEQQSKAAARVYHLDASINYGEHSLLVSQSINYTNDSGDTLTEMPLVVPAAIYENAFSALSIQISPPFQNAVVTMDGDLIHLQLEPTLAPGDACEINLIFELTPPQNKGAFGYTDRQLVLTDWFPFIPPYTQDQQWVINSPGVVGEYLAYPLSDITVNLYLSLFPKPLIVAASAPITSQQGNCYRYEAHNVRDFSFAISPDYQISSTETEHVRAEVYTFPEHAGLGERAAELAAQAWETYTDLYGLNNRQFLSVVEAEINDGLEKDGFFLLSDHYFSTADSTPKNYFECLIIHEVAHQWFYAFVHNNQAAEPWLDESLATFSELLFFEHHHPELTHWWWDFRVKSFNPSGAVNASIYGFNAYRPYINAVYLRGALFLQSIREQTGETAFLEAIKNYVHNQALVEITNADAFFEALSQTTDEDLAPIIREFFQ